MDWGPVQTTPQLRVPNLNHSSTPPNLSFGGVLVQLAVMLKTPNFSFDILSSVLGESAALDIPRLHIQNKEQAAQFIHTYGYDISNEQDLKKLWHYHQEAIEFLETEILTEEESIPSSLKDPDELQDITKLLLLASLKQVSDPYMNISSLPPQKWACAILRVMHVLVHLDNDLFTSFTDDIKYQILKPIQDHIYYIEQKTFLGKDSEAIELVSYSEKPFKHTHSAAIKILTRKNTLAMTLLDRVGVRFVTKNVIDIFKVIQYLIDNHMISYPHVISSQSKNTICPTRVFQRVLERNVSKDGVFNLQGLEGMLLEELKKLDLKVNSELNPYSSEDFKFLKFINRQFLRVNIGEGRKPLNFFFPFEIQILDQETFEKNEGGQASHEDYKQRQKRSARLRIFGL